MPTLCIRSNTLFYYILRWDWKCVIMNYFFRMIAENVEGTQTMKPKVEENNKYLVNMQILLSFMYLKYEDVWNEDFLNM